MEVRLPLPDSNPLASRLTDICLISPRARDRYASLMVWRSLMINGTKRRDIEKENATL